MNPNKRQQLLAIAAIGMVGLYVLDKVVITPMTRGWKERGEQIAQLRKDVTRGHAMIERSDLTDRRWNDMRRNTLAANPSEAEQSMLQAFDKWSRDSRISVSSIKPQWKRGTTDQFSVLECRVDAAGTLSALTRFLYEIEHSPMALKIESMELTAKDNNGQQLVLGLLVSGLRLQPLETK